MARSLVAVLLTLCACGGPAGEYDAAEALDSVEVAVAESGLLAAGAEDMPATAPLTGDELAAAAAAKWIGHFQPIGCARQSTLGVIATYELDNCSGPYGLVRVTGTLTATYALRPGGFQVTVASENLKVNNVTVNLDAVADYAMAGATRTLSVTARSSGRGSRGFAIRRDGSYTVTRDESCVTLDGTWMTTIAGRGWTTTVAGFKQCSNACPASGATLTVTRAVSDLTTTVTTDGTGSATWTSSNGRSGTIELACAR